MTQPPAGRHTTVTEPRESDRGGATAERGDAVLCAVQRLGPLSAVPFGEGPECGGSEGWAGVAGGARTAGGELLQ